jgi:hypothetical protein
MEEKKEQSKKNISTSNKYEVKDWLAIYDVVKYLVYVP